MFHHDIKHEWWLTYIEISDFRAWLPGFLFYIPAALPVFQNRQSGYNDRNTSGICHHQLTHHFSKFLSVAFCGAVFNTVVFNLALTVDIKSRRSGKTKFFCSLFLAVSQAGRQRVITRIPAGTWRYRIRWMRFIWCFGLMRSCKKDKKCGHVRKNLTHRRKFFKI